MPIITTNGSSIIAGTTYSYSNTISVDNVLTGTGAVVAGEAGIAGADGIMTMGTHGFTDADIVCVTWAAGRRYNCAISTYDGTTITVTSGAGDTLPTEGAVVVSKQKEIDIAVDGSDAQFVMVASSAAATVTLETSGAVELVKDLVANEAFVWTNGVDGTNPITGDSITKAHCYASAATAGTITINIGYNND